MDISEALNVVRAQSRAVLATRKADGDPQLSPVLVAVGDDERLIVSTRETAYKIRNLARDPRASLCVLPDNFFGRWVQVDCAAEIVRLPAAMEILVDYYRTISGEHPDWDDYRAAMTKERRVAVLLTPLKAGPNRSG
jgi:PPOX class probable F420-dependent enzyme